MLEISLFGSAHITRSGGQPAVLLARIPQSLLAYLLLAGGRMHSRAALIGAIWGEYPEAQARRCLSTAFWRLRRVIEPSGVPQGTYLLATGSEHIGFNWQCHYWLDVESFETQIATFLNEQPNALTPASVRAAEEALQLYVGPLLEGIYDDWVLHERERLQSLYLTALARLMQYHQEHQNYDASIACGEKVLAYDPLREEIHRAIMRLYEANGQPALALRQYETCRALLMRELGIAPMEETEAIHARLGGTAHPDIGSLSLTDRTQRVQEAARWLRHAMQIYEDARFEFERTLALLEEPADANSKVSYPRHVS